jgi:hypothetical protein
MATRLQMDMGGCIWLTIDRLALLILSLSSRQNAKAKKEQSNTRHGFSRDII